MTTKHLRYLPLLVSFLFVSCQDNSQSSSDMNSEQPQNERLEYAIAIHGGAGTITRENMTPEKEKEYIAALYEALDKGEEILKNGGTSMDAIQAAIISMEDSPLFNAGKGAVFTADGKNALDASIMDGATQNAGAVAGVERIKNPIIAARAVMEKSEHVMLAEEGAEEFALSQGIELVDPQYFFTQRRFDALERVKEKEKQQEEIAEEDKHGTVGAVALDKFGNLAAGTSTGGMTNKKFGRIGDAPIIGAGTYADNASCAVSSTGHGEYFIRYAVAHDIAARLEYKGIALRDAAEEVVMDKLVEKGGSGGIISVDKWGNVALVFNSEGMYRGYATPESREVAIYND